MLAAGEVRVEQVRGRSGGKHYCACTCVLVYGRRPVNVRNEVSSLNGERTDLLFTGGRPGAYVTD
jgi:hypothetical protein